MTMYAFFCSSVVLLLRECTSYRVNRVVLRMPSVFMASDGLRFFLLCGSLFLLFVCLKRQAMATDVAAEAAEEEMPLPSIPWRNLVDYERADAVYSLLKATASSFFRRDTLLVVEREEAKASPLRPFSMWHTATLVGVVGYVRRAALLSLLRRTRFHEVSDFTSGVVFGCVPGDTVPHVWLEPLAESRHIDSFRRWNRLFKAMRCGILFAMQMERERTRDRLKVLLKQGWGSAASGSQGDAEDCTSQAEHDEPRFAGLQDALSGESPVADNRNFAPVREFHDAFTEQRVDLARIVATTPTVIVTWSYRCTESVEFLDAKLFNGRFLGELRSRTGLPGKFATFMGVDPWVKFAAEYTDLPPVPTVQDGVKTTSKQKLRVLPPPCKVAQIVLVNVDPDKEAAQRAYRDVAAPCGRWRSQAVSLLSLWAGAGGLRGEYATLFGIRTMPWIVTTQPIQRDHRTRQLRPPVLLQTTTMTSTISELPQMPSKTPSQREPTTGVWLNAEPEGSWRGVPQEQRRAIAEGIGGFLTTCDAPLHFHARVDREYDIGNPYTNISTRALRSRSSSSVVLRGLATDRDLAAIKEELRLLSTLQDFVFEVQVVAMSEPLHLVVDPLTPRRIIKGLTRVVTCVKCKVGINIDAAGHLRCIHCAPPDDVLCEDCFFANEKVHPDDHIVLRVPPTVYTPEEQQQHQAQQLSLLWGPSNLFPLPRFCGKVISNNANLHLGVYCNRCRSMIRGRRWKCAECYTYDLCHDCFLKRIQQGATDPLKEAASPRMLASPPSRTRVDDAGHSRGHQPSHVMMCVRYGRGGDSDDFIRPRLLSLSAEEWLNSANEGDAVRKAPM